MPNERQNKKTNTNGSDAFGVFFIPNFFAPVIF